MEQQDGREFLQRQISAGVLALLNMRNYYWEANIHKMTLDPRSVIDLDLAKSCPSTSLLALLIAKLPIHSSQFSNKLFHFMVSF